MREELLFYILTGKIIMRKPKMNRCKSNDTMEQIKDRREKLRQMRNKSLKKTKKHALNSAQKTKMSYSKKGKIF